MQRRHLVQSLAAAGVLLVTAGCGFRLRGTPNFAFKSIYVNIPDGSAVGNDLKRALAANSALQVISDPQKMLQADVILDALADQREKTVIGSSSAGQRRRPRRVCGSRSSVLHSTSCFTPPTLRITRRLELRD